MLFNILTGTCATIIAAYWYQIFNIEILKKNQYININFAVDDFWFESHKITDTGNFERTKV